MADRDREARHVLRTHAPAEERRSWIAGIGLEEAHAHLVFRSAGNLRPEVFKQLDLCLRRIVHAKLRHVRSPNLERPAVQQSDDLATPGRGQLPEQVANIRRTLGDICRPRDLESILAFVTVDQVAGDVGQHEGGRDDDRGLGTHAPRGGPQLTSGVKR